MSQLDPGDTRPTSLLECMTAARNGGNLAALTKAYHDREDDEDEEDFRFTMALYSACSNNEDGEAKRPRKRIRTSKKIQFVTINEHGVQVPMNPKGTSWYLQYVVSPSLDSPKWCSKFRLRFRMPYDQFQKLLDIAKTTENEEGELWFRRWMSRDATGQESSPIELMLLGSLRYLGRGWTFDDIEEATCISLETHRQFFHIFIAFGRNFLYPLYVVAPMNREEAQEHLNEMAQAGMNGCLGSTDASHVLMEKCSNSQHQSHRGFKLAGTARSYNLTANHRRRILATTSGHPCRWNDKTLQIMDELMVKIDDGSILQDVTFTLLEHYNGEVVEVEYQGVWLMVDNGYLRRATTVPPMKSTLDEREIRWSQWLESMRKDVECTFGILKGRWRILKAGTRVHGLKACDDIWHTCCALHNWLLEHDGLDDKWDSGVGSDWQGENGDFDEVMVGRYAPPDAIARLSNPVERRSYDSTRTGSNVEESGERNQPREMRMRFHQRMQRNQNKIRIVKDLSLDYFRDRLIEHFDILWERHEVVWPSRNGVARPSYI